MVGSAVIKQGRSANRKHTYFFFWPYHIFRKDAKIHVLELMLNQRLLNHLMITFLCLIYESIFLRKWKIGLEYCQNIISCRTDRLR